MRMSLVERRDRWRTCVGFGLLQGMSGYRSDLGIRVLDCRSGYGSLRVVVGVGRWEVSRC